jgi:hypothetical protein
MTGSHPLISISSIEGVENAIKLVNEILANEGFPEAAIEGRAPPPTAARATPEPSPAEETAPEQTVRPKVVKTDTLLLWNDTHSVGFTGLQALVGAHPSMVQNVADKNMSKSALKRLRRKQASEEAEADQPAEDEQETEDPAPAPAPYNPATSYAAPAVAERSIPPPAPTHATSVPSQHTPSTAASTAVSAAAAEPPAPKIGIIGKTSRLSAAEVDSFRASLAHQTASPAPAPAPVSLTVPTTVSAPAPIAPPAATGNTPHVVHQQKLINLLLGDSSAIEGLSGFAAPALPAYQPFPSASSSQPSHAQYNQHDNKPATYGHLGLPQSAAQSYGHTLYNPSAGQYQPSALYAPRAPSRVVQPPGIGAQSRPNTLNLAVHTNEPQNPLPTYTGAAYTPPPPGLTPPGGVTTSRFTFAEFAPPALPTAPAASFPSHYGNAHNAYLPVGEAGAQSGAPGPAASASNYYKSKSGFSVRL